MLPLNLTVFIIQSLVLVYYEKYWEINEITNGTHFKQIVKVLGTGTTTQRSWRIKRDTNFEFKRKGKVRRERTQFMDHKFNSHLISQQFLVCSLYILFKKTGFTSILFMFYYYESMGNPFVDLFVVKLPALSAHGTLLGQWL